MCCSCQDPIFHDRWPWPETALHSILIKIALLAPTLLAFTQALGGKWAPPEAAAAAAAHAEQFSSWQCCVCTLLNAPVARTCEACGHTRPCPGEDASNQWAQGAAGAAVALLRGSGLGDPSFPPLQQAGAGGKKRGGMGGGAGPSSSAATVHLAV